MAKHFESESAQRCLLRHLNRIAKGFLYDSARVLFEVEQTYEVDSLPKHVADLYWLASLEVVLALRAEIGPPPFGKEPHGFVAIVNDYLMETAPHAATPEYHDWGGYSWTEAEGEKYWVVDAEYGTRGMVGNRTVQRATSFIQQERVIMSEEAPT